jgi:hypothetical protein
MDAPQLLCFLMLAHSFYRHGGVYPPISPIEEHKMNDQTTDPSLTKGRCRHCTARGRQCRLPVVDTRSGFCFRHAKPQPLPSDSVDLSAYFESAVTINKFLANLLALLTKGRVSPRRASVLAYIANQLLHSHRAMDYDDHRHSKDHVNIILDMPRPTRDEHPAKCACPPRRASPACPEPLGESDRD